MMRKSLWVISALLMIAALAAPSVRADSVTFTCTVDYNNPAPGNPCFEPAPTAPGVAFPGPTLIITWYSQTFDLTLPSDWSDTDANISWGASNDQFSIFDPEHLFDVEPVVTVNTFLPSGEGMSEGGPVTFTPGSVAAPEPGTSALMLIGIGLVLAVRKRKAQGLAQAA